MQMWKRSFIVALGVLIAATLIWSTRAEAQRGVPLIRDAEIESLIRDYAEPIFQAAGLGGRNVGIYLVRSSSFNAFVADGRRIFINTGALFQSDTPNQLIGVIAHETGHIAGGHLARLREQISRTRTATLATMLAGVAAAVAVGAAGGDASTAAQVGQATILGGRSVAQRGFLAYRRAEEIAADRSAVTYLNATGQSAHGMIETFEKFAGRAALTTRYADPYTRSHPVARDRIGALERIAQASPYFQRRDPPALQVRHDMMRAKLSGFLDNPRTVLRRYPRSDNSLPARYARAIARFRTADIRSAIREIDALIREQPRNPYFHELKGQALMESGRAREALKPLRQAVQLAPNENLIRISYGQALVAAGGQQNMSAAVGELKRGLSREPDHAAGWRQLAMAHGRLGQNGDAALASARSYFADGQMSLAKQQAKRAQALLRRGSPGWLQADDILNVRTPRS